MLRALLTALTVAERKRRKFSALMAPKRVMMAPKKPRNTPLPTDTVTSQLRKRISQLAGQGFRQEDIARACRLSLETLRKCYKQELELGAIHANAAVAANIFRIATGDGPDALKAAIYWTRTRAGWVERSGRDAADDEARENEYANAKEEMRIKIDAMSERLANGTLKLLDIEGPPTGAPLPKIPSH
jgi:hypothetical protein